MRGDAQRCSPLPDRRRQPTDRLHGVDVEPRSGAQHGARNVTQWRDHAGLVVHRRNCNDCSRSETHERFGHRVGLDEAHFADRDPANDRSSLRGRLGDAHDGWVLDAARDEGRGAGEREIVRFSATAREHDVPLVPPDEPSDRGPRILDDGARDPALRVNARRVRPSELRRFGHRQKHRRMRRGRRVPIEVNAAFCGRRVPGAHPLTARLKRFASANISTLANT